MLIRIPRGRSSELKDNQRQSRRRGAIVVLVAMCLPIFVIMAMFAVDVAFMELTRAELRTATDAAARAGARTLSATQDDIAARADAKEAAQKNLVTSQPLLLADEDIDIGSSRQSSPTLRYDFTNNGVPWNSVRVTGRRAQNSLSGHVHLFFAGFLNHSKFEPIQQAIATQVERDLALVLDQSGSMQGQRWLDLALAVEAFLSTLEATPQEELVSLATFGTTATFHHELSLNYNQIRATINGITPDGYTAIGEGMQQGLNALALQPRLAERVTIIITDGIHNTGIDPITVAQAARAQGFIVYTITFSDEADQVAMQEVASVGGGRHWHAPTGADLTDAFEEIANGTRTLLTE